MVKKTTQDVLGELREWASGGDFKTEEAAKKGRRGQGRSVPPETHKPL